ncbi:MAG: HAD-IC family P-type ATPase, partial [Coriobacteriales bacterium]|nr:HAD-IC family P-type ATPase [Coriobacteriales bacterium]
FLFNGSIIAQVTAVGNDNYATKINNEAKQFKKVKSTMLDALNKIITFSSCLIAPLGALLAAKELLIAHSGINDTILHTSAALVGMIPQGFILLTSAALAVSVFRLAQHKVLIQELYCVETLARVDVICLDKTGTITTGEMEVDEVIPLSNSNYQECLEAIYYLDEFTDNSLKNETNKAISKYIQNLDDFKSKNAQFKLKKYIPFSSDTKYSGICLENGDNIVIGAPEFLLKFNKDKNEIVQNISKILGSRRGLLIAKANSFDEKDKIDSEVVPLGFILIKDCIRNTTIDTLNFFKEQGVEVKIISGDNLETVKNIAKSVSVDNWDKAIDMSTIKSDDELIQAANTCTIFARVSPEQKKKLVVALKNAGHTVAMTGDGVNDVLALHEADCSIAMGSGSDAARKIAQIILVDNNFASMPHVVAEGRRCINNLERSGALFLVKTLFSATLALLFIFIICYSYPFVTIQLTLISAFTIGLPSFVLALEPNEELVKGNFLRNIIFRALPGAFCVVFSIILACIISFVLDFDQQQFSTICTVVACIVGLNFVIRLCIPFNPIRIAMLVVICGGIFIGIFVIPDLFMLSHFNLEMAITVIILCALNCFLLNLLFSLVIKKEHNLNQLLNKISKKQKT